MDRKKWEDRDMNREEVEIKIHDLEEQIIAFELNVKYEEKTVAFRTIYLEWYEGRLNLSELLEAMMDRSICKRISVFPR